MIVGVTGSRGWNDPQAIRRGLLGAQGTRHAYEMTLVHGRCPPRTQRGGVIRWNQARLLPYRQQVRLCGADWLACVIAHQLGWAERAFAADWDKHGGGAGFVRNTDMVNKSRADLWLAFISACTSPGRWCAGEPHGTHGGTDCLNKAAAAGIPYVLNKRGW